MKTGSTAIQDALHACRNALLSRGISAHHILARELQQQMDQVLTQERETDHPVVLLSSEFFGQVPPQSIRQILERIPADRHAMLLPGPYARSTPASTSRNSRAVPDESHRSERF